MSLCCMCNKREGANKSNIGEWYCQPCTDSLEIMDDDELIYRLEEEIKQLQEALDKVIAKNNQVEEIKNKYKKALESIYKDTFYESEHDLISPIHTIRKRAEKALYS